MPSKVTYGKGLFLNTQLLIFSAMLLIWGIPLSTMNLNTYSQVLEIALILVWITLILMFKGVVIDYDKRKFRSYLTVLGFRIGKWRDASQFQFYKIKRNINENSITSRPGTHYYTSKVTYLYIYDSTNKREILLLKGKLPELQKLVKELNAKLGIKKAKRSL